MVREACYAHFRKKHPNAVAVSSQEELEELIEKGMTNVVYTGGYGSSIRGAGSYVAMKRTPEPQPLELLQAFYQKHRAKFLKPVDDDLQLLLAKAHNWRLKL